MEQVIVDGVLILDNKDLTGDASPVLNDLLEEGSRTGRFKSIRIPEGAITLKSQLLLPANMELTGGSTKRTIHIEPADVFEPAITTNRKGRTYAAGISITNIEFIVKSTCNLVFESNRHLELRFTNVTLDGQFKTSIGIRLGSDDSNEGGAISSQFSDIDIKRCGVGVDILNVGNIHVFRDRVAVKSCDIGVRINNAKLVRFDHGCAIENNSLATFDILSAKTVLIDGCYFEDGNFSVVNTDHFVFQNNYISGITNFNFSGAGAVTIEGNRLAAGSMFTGDARSFNLNKNWYQSEGNFIFTTLVFAGTNFESYGNFGDDWSQRGSFRDGLASYERTPPSDKLENMVANSGSSLVDTNDYYEVIKNGDDSPVSGNPTADIIEMKKDWDGDNNPRQMYMGLASHKLVGDDLPKAGDVVTFSRWMKIESDARFLLLSFDVGSGESYRINVPADGVWRRVVYTTELQKDASFLRNSILKPKIGDVITVDHFQMVKGDDPLSEFETGDIGTNTRRR